MSKSRRGATRAIFFLSAMALLFLATGCQGGHGSEVRLALQPPSTNNYPGYFAQWLGFYRQEGLHVTISQIAGASRVLEAVVGGSADVGGGVYEQSIQMAAEGRGWSPLCPSLDPRISRWSPHPIRTASR